MSDSFKSRKININTAGKNNIYFEFAKKTFSFNFNTVKHTTKYEIATDTALDDLTDVQLNGVDDLHILKYDKSSEKWVNQAFSTLLSGYVEGTQVIMSGSKITLDQAKIDHDQLLNFTQTEHRIINDSGTSVTELWSANKISVQLALKASSTHGHTESDITDLDRYTQSQVDTLLAAKAILGHTHTESDVTDLDKYTQGEITSLLSLKAALVHTHTEASITDLDKYTQDEVDVLVAARALLVHSHDDLYYTQTELDNGLLDTMYYTIAAVDALLNNKADLVHNHNSLYYTIDDIDTEWNTHLSTYDHTELHAHSNKALLDTYLQTELNLASAVSKKHTQNSDTATTSNTFHIGDGTNDEDKRIVANDATPSNQAELRYHIDTQTWQYSNDGVTFTDIGSGGSASVAISDLTDVDLTDLANDKILKYNSTSEKWECVDESGSGAGVWGSITGTLANQLDLLAALGAKAASVHTHVEADITDLAHYTSSDFNTDFSGKNLDNLSDGTTYKRSHNDLTDTLKNKLDGIEANANNYTLPTATGAVLGGVKIGSRITITAGVISADVQSDVNFTSTLKSKLDGIASGAEVNVQSDWNSISGDSLILNKPTIPTALSELSDDLTHRLVTDTEKSTWNAKSDLTLAEVKLDADIASAISLKHTQNSDTDLDATFEATFVKKLDTVNVLSDITSAGADIESAVSLKHTQGTDQGLDTGGANAVTAAQAKAGYTHSGVTSGNPHNVTPTELSLLIGTNVQAYDAGLSSLSGLVFVSDSFIKITATDTYAVRTIAETKTDLSINNVLNTLHKYDATVAPDANDDSGDGYSVGSIWIDVTADKAYVCVDATPTSAVWREVDVIAHEATYNHTLLHSNSLDHAQNTDTDLDATFEATFVKKTDTVNVLSDITSSGADIEDAVTKKHDGGAQDTAIGLNTTHRGLTSGNPHSVSKSDVGLGNVDNKSEATIITDVKADVDVADAISKKHTQGSDTTLGSMSANIDMNSHKLTGLAVPSSNGDSIRATTKITEANLEAAIDYKLSSGEYTELTAWLDDVTLGASGALTLPTGQNFSIGSTQWNKNDNIDADAIIDGSTNAIMTLTQETNFEAAYSHISNDGSDHSFIDQSVISTASPDFGGLTVEKANAKGILAIETYDEDNANYSQLFIRKSANETLGSKTQTADTEILGQIIIQGVDDGNGFSEGFKITATQDGSVGSYVPTTVKMETYQTSGINYAQLVLDQDGSVMLGNATYDCGSLKMIKGAQTGDPQVEFSLSADDQGDFTIATDTGDINISPTGDVKLNANVIMGASSLTINAVEIVGSDGEVNKAAVEDSGNWDSAYSHISNDGSDHSYIDQSVVSGATPTFGIDNFSDGGGLVLITGTQETNFETAYSHSQDNSQAHTDYLINNNNDETSGILTAGGFVLGTNLKTQYRDAAIYINSIDDGHLDLTADVSIDINGLLDLPTGQIKFPATANPSADANTLDDYEEGTWVITCTPTTSGTVTIDSSNNSCHYTKIGNVVTVGGRIQISAVSSPVGNAQFTLPFAVANLAEGADYSTGTVALSNAAFTGTYLTAFVDANTATFYLISSTASSATVTQSANIFSGDEVMLFTITYTTAT